MAGSVNKVILIGNLGADPEVRRLNNDGMVVNLRIATSETWRDKTSGERKERTEWHQVMIWNEGVGKVAEKYLSKGDKVYIEGQLETRKWEKDGVERYSTEVVLRPFAGTLTMLQTKGQDDGGSRDGGSSRDGGGSREGSSRGGGDRRQSSGGGGSREHDDEIPF